MKRIKFGIILMFLGLGIPLSLYYFQEDGKFKIYIKTHDALRETEVEALNLIKGLSKSYKEVYSILNRYIQKEMLLEFEGLLITLIVMEKEIEHLEKAIDKINRIPNYNITQGKLKISPIVHSIGVPYKYSIGLGIILFLIGLCSIVLLFVEKKKVESLGNKAEKD